MPIPFLVPGAIAAASAAAAAVGIGSGAKAIKKNKQAKNIKDVYKRQILLSPEERDISAEAISADSCEHPKISSRQIRKIPCFSMMFPSCQAPRCIHFPSFSALILSRR